MNVALAATWNPRGELARLCKLQSLIEEVYAGVVICFPPAADPRAVRQAREEVPVPDRIPWTWVESPDWSWGRYLALKTALALPASYIQYADLDRLLRWMETRPDEWRSVVGKIGQSDCLVAGRTPAAYATHPQSLVQTEAISNRVISSLLGRAMDVSAGSKGFSREAAEWIIAHSVPGRALGTDGEWPVLALRAGYRVDYVEVDGLDWESADRYRAQAAGPEDQRQAAAEIDADPQNWARRVAVAREIVEAGLEANQLEVPLSEQFDLNNVFEVDDYLYFYGDMLTDEVTERQVAFLVRELDLAPGHKVLDLACGFGRHANRLAAIGCEVTGIDYMPRFLELAREDAAARGVQVDYRQGDMRSIDFQDEFDRVILMFTAFGYFDDDTNFQVLARIARVLKPGGKLAFDIHNRDVFLKGFRPEIVTEKEGNLMIDRNSFDTATGRDYNRRIVIRDGVRRDKPFFVRLYNANEITSLLHQAGFREVQLFGAWDSEPLSVESRRMIIVARK